MQAVSKRRYTIALFGETGVGKSSLGNDLADCQNLFKVGHTTFSETAEFTLESGYLGGNLNIPIDIIDAPGLGDNNGLLNSKIYQKFASFLLTNKIQLSCILFCIKQTKKLPETIFDDLNNFIDILGKAHINNIYIVITQLDILNEKYKKETVQLLQTELPIILPKKVQGFNPKNIIMPDQSQFAQFIHSMSRILESSRAVTFKMDDFELTNSSEIPSRLKAHLTVTYEDAYHQVKDLLKKYHQEGSVESRMLKKLQEQMILIDIVNHQKGESLPTILECTKSAPSNLLREIYNYFYSDKYDFTLKEDIREICETFNKNDEQWRLNRSNFGKALITELDNTLLPKVIKSLFKILKKHSQELKKSKDPKFKDSSTLFLKNRVKIPGLTEAVLGAIDKGFLSTGGFGASCTAISLLTQVFAGASVEGGLVAGGVAGVVSSPLFLVGVGTLAIGLIGYGINSVSWTRKTAIQEITLEIKNIILDPKIAQLSKPLTLVLEYICLLYSIVSLDF